jgi:hypothetical protein
MLMAPTQVPLLYMRTDTKKLLLLRGTFLKIQDWPLSRHAHPTARSWTTEQIIHLHMFQLLYIAQVIATEDWSTYVHSY